MNTLQQILKEKAGHLSRTDKIYRSILKDILMGVHPSGEKLTEAQFCQLYNTSRTPIREAFRQLEKNGLIEYIPNKGAFVKGISGEEISDMLQLRKDCEIRATSWGIQRITEEEEEELNEIFSYMEFYTKKRDVQKMIDINSAFHRIIYKAAKNNILNTALLRYQTYTHYCCPANYFAERYLERVLEEHRLIYNAFLDKNPEAGAKAMEIHMENSIRRRL